MNIWNIEISGMYNREINMRSADCDGAGMIRYRPYTKVFKYQGIRGVLRGVSGHCTPSIYSKLQGVKSSLYHHENSTFNPGGISI